MPSKRISINQQCRTISQRGDCAESWCLGMIKAVYKEKRPLPKRLLENLDIWTKARSHLD